MRNQSFVVKVLFTFLYVTLAANIWAANIVISGKIINKQTGNPIPFVNMAIVGKPVGTTTNENGEFELKIADKYASDTIGVSAIGFFGYSFPVSKYANQTGVVIELAPQVYNIVQVNVTASSLSANKTLNEARARIPRNYYIGAVSYSGNFVEQRNINDTLRTREALVMLYDQAGYQRVNALDAYNQRRYRFDEARRSFDVNKPSDGLTGMDELINYDIVRMKGNILDSLWEKNFDIKLEKTDNKDTVWIISYTCKKPSLITTGDYYATAYKGKLYIRKNDYAIVRNETDVQASTYAMLGRSFFASTVQPTVRNVSYRFVVQYAKIGSRYHCQQITVKRTFDVTNNTTKQTRTQTNQMQWTVKETNTTAPQAITTRTYYENMPYKDTFWKGKPTAVINIQ